MICKIYSFVLCLNKQKIKKITIDNLKFSDIIELRSKKVKVKVELRK